MEAIIESLNNVDSEVCAYASKALGALTSESPQFVDICLRKLRSILHDSAQSSPFRLACSQAFCEIIARSDRVTKQLVSQLLSNISKNELHLKESYLGVFIYLPMITGQRFKEFVYDVVDTVVTCIQEDNKKIRNLAIRSMKIIIKNFLF